jgi:hypothetical protein
MRFTLFLFSSLLAVAVAACADIATDQIAAPRLVTGRASLAKEPSKQEVTGHAAFLLGATPAAYSLSAVRHVDGHTSGEFEAVIEVNGGVRLHGSVTCFTIFGNAARLAARIDQSSSPDVRAGSFLIWTLSDNGEGANEEFLRA